MAPCRSETTHTSIFLSPRASLDLWWIDFYEISNLSHVEVAIKGLYLPIFGFFYPFCSLFGHSNGILSIDPQFFGLKLVSCWKFCMLMPGGHILPFYDTLHFKEKKLETNSTRKLQHVLDTINQNWFCPWSLFCCRGSLSPLKSTRWQRHWSKMHQI